MPNGLDIAITAFTKALVLFSITITHVHTVIEMVIDVLMPFFASVSSPTATVL